MGWMPLEIEHETGLQASGSGDIELYASVSKSLKPDMSTSEWIRHKLPQVIELSVFAIDVSVRRQTRLDCPSAF